MNLENWISRNITSVAARGLKTRNGTIIKKSALPRARDPYRYFAFSSGPLQLKNTGGGRRKLFPGNGILNPGNGNLFPGNGNYDKWAFLFSAKRGWTVQWFLDFNFECSGNPDPGPWSRIRFG